MDILNRLRNIRRELGVGGRFDRSAQSFDFILNIASHSFSNNWSNL